VRAVASAVNEGADVEAAVRDAGVELGRLRLRLPPDTYVELRRRASMENVEPDDVVADALDEYLAGD
jgi:hypothetical protein